MTTRRSFLSTVATSAAAAALARRARAATAKPPLGLQLYSLRKQLEKDVPGTLKQIKAWGIDDVESFGPHNGMTAAALKDAGLRCQAFHVGSDRLNGEMATVLKEADALGVTTVINPFLSFAKPPFATREEILRAAGEFAKWSKACRAAGKRFAYHIHGQEFGPDGQGTLFDLLAKESGPDVGFEADVFWITAGGADPVKLMGQYPGRFWFTHLKDMAKTEGAVKDRANVVLGTGSIDIKGVVAAGAAAGVEMHYLEDESAAVLSQVPSSVAYYKSL
ncbi:MAG: sugar phosphate isomerase/epimerase family protein [Vicinamibacterales bacterium]|jgi:sugar phosphate isomerase/epimerase